MTDERIRILVVDDDPELLDTLREYLENLENRYVVETAVHGSEALLLVARARPDVVILDVEYRLTFAARAGTLLNPG